MMGKLMGGLGAKMGLPGGAGMPDLSRMDPKQLEEMAKAMQAGGGPGGLPPGLGGAGGLPGLGSGFPGLPRKK